LEYFVEFQWPLEGYGMAMVEVPKIDTCHVEICVITRKKVKRIRFIEGIFSGITVNQSKSAKMVFNPPPIIPKPRIINLTFLPKRNFLEWEPS